MMLTTILRQFSGLPFIAKALSASFCAENVTNAKPRDWPVSRFTTSRTSSRLPYGEKSASTSPSVAEKARFSTNSLFWLHLMPPDEMSSSDRLAKPDDPAEVLACVEQWDFPR